MPEQLDELARRMPALYNNEQFVYARLRKLAPGADADAEFDPVEREAWLVVGVEFRRAPAMSSARLAQ